MKALVVVYSRTGRTLAVGKRIAEDLDADIEVIEEPRGRRGLTGFVRSGFEALRGKEPPIVEPKRNPTDYELVIVGSPIWAGRMASPIRTYLSRFSGAFHQAAFFCTSSGGRNERALTEMARLASVEPTATIEISASQLDKGAGSGAIARFVSKFKDDGTAAERTAHFRVEEA